ARGGYALDDVRRDAMASLVPAADDVGLLMGIRRVHAVLRPAGGAGGFRRVRRRLVGGRPLEAAGGGADERRAPRTAAGAGAGGPDLPLERSPVLRPELPALCDERPRPSRRGVRPRARGWEGAPRLRRERPAHAAPRGRA